MDVVSILIPLILLLLLTNLSTNDASKSLCSPSKCNNNPNSQSPEIRPPFYIQGTHLPPCGLPGFSLSCNNHNLTIIHFKGYGDLIVKSISYDARWVDLVDPNKCVHQVLLNLNVSATPFRSYYLLKKYMYLNCSEGIGGSIMEVLCLSGLQHRVYVVERFSNVPSFCRVVKVVRIPFAYSPFLSDGSFGLRLTWAGHVGQTGYQYNWNKYFKVGGSISMVMGILIVGTWTYYYKHGEHKKRRQGLEKGDVKFPMLRQDS